MREEATDLKSKTDNMIADIKARFQEIEIHIPELKTKISKLDDLDNTIKMCKSSMEIQARRLAYLDDRGRRCNLVVFGVTQDPDETELDLRRKVITEKFQGKPGAKCEPVGRIHRFGRSAANRPIILFFEQFSEKASVLKNASKLKGTKFSVQDDYFPQTLKKRIQLLESAKTEKVNVKKVFLTHDKLNIASDVFIWN